ncbi:MAG TPA: NTP transferase domain-containing protein, partial [Candidatus Limnocylindria bacterium]|nr:NTP transferase domain-containing protein [Candidatus Limnocylindria bacterium]
MTAGPPGIVLAAGLGTRMRSQTPKVLHLVAGWPLLAHVLDAVRGAGARPVVVLSKESEPARAIVDVDAVVAMQDPPRGTGDAVRVALGAIPSGSGEAFIVYGDTPLLRASTLRALSQLRTSRGAPLALLSGKVGIDNAYGRVVRDTSGDVARVVEARLATADERRLPESNLGAYAVDLAWLRKAVPRLRANDTGEVFLTDLVALASADGARVAAYCTEDPD